jgi:tetratricopeptide (TPR) repeat protein
MKKFIGLFLLMLLFISIGRAQDLDGEIGFKYVKADYLIKTQRTEEALKELSDIIRDNPSFKDVLFLRADLRFKGADYINAKGDVLKSIELKGITKEMAALLGRSDFALRNIDAAEASLETAILLGNKDEKVLLEYAEILYNKNQSAKACDIWQIASRNGSSTAAINITKNCSGNTNSSKTTEQTTLNQPALTENKPTSITPPLSTDSVSESNPVVVTNDTSNTSETTAPPTFSFPVPEEDNTPNEIVIDEDLTITIYGQGTGKRKILEKPSILILSENDGEVAIEICINENGRIETAEFVPTKSTIDNKGLVSLAIRKSKEFWFEKSEFRKQCGFIVYKVKGS